MGSLIFTLGGVAVIGLAFNFWMSYTKSGKKWLDSLSD